MITATLHPSPLEALFREFVDSIEESCVICSPYITSKPVRMLLGSLERKGIVDSVRVTVLADVSPMNVAQGATDPEALLRLQLSARRTQVYYLPRIHAKVYTSDCREALVGSANFTSGGLCSNLEYVVRFTEATVVSGIERDISRYAALGAALSPSDLEFLSSRTKPLRDALAREAEAIRKASRSASAALQERVGRSLRVARVRGRPMYSVFADTVRYLLAQQPMTTEHLYESVAAIHPDLCDDSETRVISGDVRVIWRWRLRQAQNGLKRQGAIVNDPASGLWSLVGEDVASIPL